MFELLEHFRCFPNFSPSFSEPQTFFFFFSSRSPVIETAVLYRAYHSLVLASSEAVQPGEA